jgi:hypothetical protein
MLDEQWLLSVGTSSSSHWLLLQRLQHALHPALNAGGIRVDDFSESCCVAGAR